MSKTERVGIYPGTFDPITNGHMDIISRAAKHLCDELVISVAVNPGKGPIFSLEERVAMVKAEIATLTPELPCNVVVRPFGGLLMHWAEECGAELIVRGLRAVSDFEYEFQMTGMNARLNKEVETVFLMSSERHQFISSRFVKEIRQLGGDISQFVSPRVMRALDAKFEQLGQAER
jgi:pantetheine-phosphate adenylyltransferase